MPTKSIATKKENMADTLILVKESIDKKISLAEKINSLIDKMDKVHREPELTNYSPTNS